MRKMFNEFKKFAIKGNAVDLAIGVVIGAAFGNIVSSLVADIINPFISLSTGGIDFANKIIVLRSATENAAAVTLNYGVFITAIIDFIIIAFAIFMVVKYMNKLVKKGEKKISKEVELLTEIRDNLKS